jgi:type I restriction enzyme S subunit
VRIHSYAEQETIAAILSAYDDLIENNTRRIAILEEMARLIYREWFVHFRFPGHENVPMVDSPLGPIPEGWEVRELGEIADVRWGDTRVTKKSYVSDGYDAYSASGPDGKLDYYDYDRLGIVLSAIGAQCGKTWLAWGKWSCIKNTIRMWATSPAATTEYLYLVTEAQDFWPRRGAAQPFISQTDAQKCPILVPTPELNESFTSSVSATFEQVNVLKRSASVARETRDLLLPRLISGELDVSSPDIETPQELPA